MFVVSFTNTKYIFLISCIQIQAAFGVIPDQLVISLTKCYHNNLFCGFDLWEHFDKLSLGHKSHSHSCNMCCTLTVTSGTTAP
jgi:hypothetical protein